MTVVRAVCDVGFDVGTARTVFPDVTERCSTALEIDEYVEHGGSVLLPAEVRLTRETPADAFDAWSTSAFFSSARLRTLLEEAAPGDLDAYPQPVLVAARPMWHLRIATVLDAVDLDASELTLDSGGQVRFYGRLVWRASVLTRPAIFRIPQLHGQRFVTDAVAAAYLASGYTGLLVGGPKGRLG